MEAGIITREEFNSCCSQIVEVSKQLSDNFVWMEFKHEKEKKYLTKTSTKMIAKGKHAVAEENSEADLDDEMMMVHNDVDDDIQISCVAADETLLKFEHHIVYSDSYNVPVLYFMVCNQDGSMVSLDDVWKIVPEQHQHALQEKWSFVSQQEHPYLSQPWYQVHPCHTENLMKTTQTIDRATNYVLMWLSLIGPVACFDLPMEYYKRIADEKDRL